MPKPEERADELYFLLKYAREEKEKSEYRTYLRGHIAPQAYQQQPPSEEDKMWAKRVEALEAQLNAAIEVELAE